MTLQPHTHCHSRCDTLKNPHIAMTMNAENISNLIVLPNGETISEWDKNPKTNIHKEYIFESYTK